MAIVKANAYGHGLDIITHEALRTEEVDQFGVATEEEGCRLRRMTRKPILVLTGALFHEVDIFLENNLDFTLTDRLTLHKIAERARALGTKGRVHLKVDTGMRRMGVEPEEALSFLREIEQLTDAIELVGLATHFATSDETDQAFFRKQLATFDGVQREARSAGIQIPLVHAANSGAILQAPKDSAFDLVRPGIMLYGYAPSLELQERVGSELRPPLALTSSIVFKKRVRKGEGVSYNLRWHAERDTHIATVPVGYGDGYPRLLTNRTDAIIKGKSYPVVGTICMDQIMIDVGDDYVEVSDRVDLLEARPDGLNAWKLASTIGTIPYEILTGIAARVPRTQV